jgi:hypothetical protein
MTPEPDYASMWRVVRVVQLDAPSERIIGPFPPGDAAMRWVDNNRTDKWIMIQSMPLELPEGTESVSIQRKPRPYPKSLGMGKGGPAGLSEREGFGEG